MKAVLILPEMPDKCTKCPACSGHGVAAFCRAKGKFMNACIGGKPDWCPLRPMPEKRNQPDSELKNMPYSDGVQHGFNLCLRAIEGSEKDDV